MPPQVILVAPTGTTPRASAWSWSVQPRVATRVGSSSMVVSPKACSIVTGKASASAEVVAVGSLAVASLEVEPVLHPVSSAAARPTVVAATVVRREARFMGISI